ncbi:Poly(U)-specific endoribonuclease homolog [Gryllus bimaculatus]|nr:Poly(U)-specific endoribonuclease homolog [Gryllus bimaculatus]
MRFGAVRCAPEGRCAQVSAEMTRPASAQFYQAVIGRMAMRTDTASHLLVLLCSVTVYGAPSRGVSDDALRNISETLLANDVNNAAKHIRINYQSRTDSNSATDDAPDPLLTVASEALNISTVSMLRKTFDNYVADTRVNEQITDEEMNEENNLLNAFIATPIMEHTSVFI